MSRKDGEPASMKDIFTGLRLPKTVKDHLKNHALWSKWEDIVGSELSRVTEPGDLKLKILTISVAHQAWAQQLHFLKASILGKIRSICPDAEVKDLHFRVSMITTKKSSVASKRELSKILVGPLPERLEMTLRAVEDPDLRESIRKAMTAEYSRRSNSTN